MPEWSKGCVSRTHGENLVGSNPTSCIDIFLNKKAYYMRFYLNFLLFIQIFLLFNLPFHSNQPMTFQLVSCFQKLAD
jgi:hypothetical protein